MKKLKFSGRFDINYPTKLTVEQCIWPIISSDQWFLPKFKVEIENLAKEIQRGSIEIYITEFENIKSLSATTSYKGPFQDVYIHRLGKFKLKEKKKFKFKIESRYLKPGNYIMRITLTEWIPSDTPLREIKHDLENAKISTENKKVMRQFAINSLSKSGIDPYKKPQGQFKSKPLFDLRSSEVIKVHPIGTTITIISSLLLAIIGGIVKLLFYVCSKLR